MTIKVILSIITVIFSFLMIYITQLNYKKKIYNIFYYFFWNFIWVSLIFSAVRPKTIGTIFFNHFNIDLYYIFSILGILTLLILNYFLFSKVKILEIKLEKLIRSVAIGKIIKNKKLK